MGKSIRTTSNTQTTTNTPANQAPKGLDDGLSIVTTSIQRKVNDTLAMTGYGKEGSQ